MYQPVEKVILMQFAVCQIKWSAIVKMRKPPFFIGLIGEVPCRYVPV